MPIPSDCIQINCAAGNRTNAADIASALVERRYAACAQLSDIESYYRWDGKAQHEPEVMIHIKTTASRLDDVKSVIVEIHTYELPEISVLPIVAGSDAYLNWIRESVGDIAPALSEDRDRLHLKSGGFDLPPLVACRSMKSAPGELANMA